MTIATGLSGVTPAGRLVHTLMVWSARAGSGAKSNDPSPTGTASAAEILAGCLKAHGRAVVVGERTYGKGSAQAVLPGDAGPGARYATVATFTLPDGEPVEGRGVLPDVEVPSSGALDAARALIASHLCPNEVR